MQIPARIFFCVQANRMKFHESEIDDVGPIEALGNTSRTNTSWCLFMCYVNFLFLNPDESTVQVPKNMKF